jgi:hypothetical protein
LYVIPATVSASALAVPLDCSRTDIGKLEAEGVIQRQGDDFPLDQNSVAILAARTSAITARQSRSATGSPASAIWTFAANEKTSVSNRYRYLTAFNPG